MARVGKVTWKTALFRSIFGGRKSAPAKKEPAMPQVKPRTKASAPPKLGPSIQNAPAVIVKTPTLSGHDLLRSFGTGGHKTYAIQNVSVELQKNEMNLLMGPSGSGKTTLLAVLSALLRPCGGRVTALGHEIWQMNNQQLEQFRLKHCSYVFQGFNLFPALTAREQLEIVLKWGEGANTREARKRADEVLGQLGLGSKMHLRPAQMSGGEKQRVAIGRALVKNPSFLFADEPTSALDWENGQQVIQLLNDVARKRGSTVLVVTHDPRLMPYADNIFHMADGKLCVEQECTEIVDLAPVPSAYSAYHPAMMPHGPHIAGGGSPLFHSSARFQAGPRLMLKDPAFSGQ